MAKSANAGEMRTVVRFVRVTRTNDDDGYPHETEGDVFTSPVFVKWVNAHGSEVFEALEQKVKEPATITMRYSPAIDETMILYKGSDARPYEIISVNNVEDRNAWLEIKVQRKVAAR